MEITTDPIKQEIARTRGLVFRPEGDFTEMVQPTSAYREQTAPISGVEYDFYHGGTDTLHALVAAVDPEWVQYFSPHDDIFCAYVDGVPVAFCILEENPDYALVADSYHVGSIGCVGTDPAYRRRGIGLRMVDLAAMHLKNRGCDLLYIHCTHINKWYAKLGYEVLTRYDME